MSVSLRSKPEANGNRMLNTRLMDDRRNNTETLAQRHYPLIIALLSFCDAAKQRTSWNVEVLKKPEIWYRRFKVLIKSLINDNFNVYNLTCSKSVYFLFILTQTSF